MKLILVRHGQSMANLAELVTGNTADELSPHGIERSRETGAWLTRLGFQPDVCYMSQWRRAQQTAALLKEDCQFVVDARLGETQAGTVADMPLKQFLATWPNFYTDNTHAYPGGESHTDLNRRVLQWLGSVRELHQTRTVLAVTHAGPIACLLQHALGIPMDRFPAVKAHNSSVSVIDYGAQPQDCGQVVAFSLLPESAAAQLIIR